ncbi:Dam family site-specific DNA-(adenine-N6)-methyltransferase, partial [Glaciimonas sp. Cout2]|uniref:DNA adenine methylase n=1 Tax=Glaciimonas sp. Cout2 TaxID=3048621 RepID=UPI002B231661
MNNLKPSWPAMLADTKPLLKWAGGKTQLLEELISKMPKKYGRYIEPFFGGGALFFSVRPRNGIIADSNPELVNLYRSVANSVDEVISFLSQYQNTEEFFYDMRAQDSTKMTAAEAAARTIFLNRTCFNGLYRVNRQGQFNVPFGRYKNPKILDEASLQAASILLRDTTIVCGDYKTVLREHAQQNDFIFLDPPYLPVSEYADFKRYTKEQFYEEDHIE